MPDLALVTGAVSAGFLCGGSVVLGAGDRRWLAAPTLARLRRAWATDAGWWRWLAGTIERAGWPASTRQVGWAGLGAAVVPALVGLAVSPPVAGLGFVAGAGAWLLLLQSAAERRSRRIEGELVPLLELFTLELSGGGSALSALGSVAVQVDGNLASDLRRMLIASQIPGSPSFEARLIDYSERVGIPALGSLATILAASREYGTGTGQGVRALAIDLRRGQRRELIARSRRALNHVLLPAAFGVLLPFLGILLFPAVSVLQRSLR